MSNVELRVSHDEAIGFLSMAVRNWSHVPKLSNDDLEDVATALCAFLKKRTDRPVLSQIHEALQSTTLTATFTMINRYRRWMTEMGVAPVQSPDGVGIPHTCWMLDEMNKQLSQINPTFDLCKASRWLGFIQHEIISAGWTTVIAERDFSRPLFKPNQSGRA